MLEVRGVSVSFGAVEILRDVSFMVNDAQTVALLGPSGVGKSTLLRVIAGLVDPDTGGIFINAKDVSQIAPHRREVGLVFQDNALLPHLTVSGNIAYGLRQKRLPRRDRARRVADLLTMMRIENLRDRKVDTLSGGEAKRVAVARTLAPEPHVVLLDEPLTGLDSEIYESVITDLTAALKGSQASVVWVTHNLNEAERVASEIIRL
jgi:thiamine transport system ATP-binding protein